MKRMFWLVVGIGLGIGGAYTASKNHFVRATSGFEMVPRAEAGFEDAYVDARSFTASDWWQHPTLTADIMRAGKQHLMTGTVQNTINTALPGMNPQAPTLQQPGW